MSWLSRIGIVLASIILGLLAVEGILRLTYKGQDPLHGFTDPTFYKPAPYSMFKGQSGALFGWNGRDLYFNDKGYRGEVPAAVKPKGEKRIFVLGGSTVLGGQKDFPSLLEAELRSRGFSQVKVFNYGVSASNSGQNLMRLVDEVIEEKPDLILMYEGANDFENPYYADPRPGFPYNFMVTEANPVYQRDVTLYPMLALILYGSLLARRLCPNYFLQIFGNQEALRRRVRFRSRAWRDRIVDRLWTNFSKAALISKAAGARFIGIFQPMIYYKDHRTPEESGNLNALVPDGAYEMNELRERLRVKAKGASFAFHDLSDLFDSRKDRVFTDTVHLEESEQSAVAKALADILFNRAARQGVF